MIVAEGRWSSSNPEHLVHFQRLGLGACRVFVDVVKVKDASVWRTSSEIEYMEDALGSTLAWPEDKIITVRVLFIFLFFLTWKHSCINVNRRLCLSFQV